MPGRRHHTRFRRTALLASVVLLQTVVAPSRASSAPTTVTVCASNLANTSVPGPLDIPSGAICALTNVAVTGTTTVEGTLAATNTTFHGSMDVKAGATDQIHGGDLTGSLSVGGPGTTLVVDGATTFESSVTVDGPGTSGSIACPVNIKGALGLTNAAVAITGTGCSVGADLHIFRAATGTSLALARLTVGGAVQLLSNNALIELGNAHITGSLVCTNNNPPPVNAGGNVVGGATVDQCAGGRFALDSDGATVPSVTVTSAVLTPTLSVGLVVDHLDAIPGDTLDEAATVTNVGSKLTVAGDLGVTNTGSVPITAAAFADTLSTAPCNPAPADIPGAPPGLACQHQKPDPNFREECACPAGIPGPLDAVLAVPPGAPLSPWTALASGSGALAGFIPLVSPPSASALTLTLTAVPTSGVSYPGNGQILGTTIQQSSTARWHYTATVNLTTQQAATLADTTLTAAVKASFHVEGTPNPDPQLDLGFETADSLFCAELYGPQLSAAARGVTVTVKPPSGPAVIFNSTGNPALASIAPGAKVTVTDKYRVPVPAARTPGETDAAYLARLKALDRSKLVAYASAVASKPQGVSATATPVTTIEHLPIVGITKTGPASAENGTTVTYGLALGNGGSATAGPLGVTDTVAGGASATVTGVPATLAPAASANAQASYLIPPTQPPGALGDTASVTWTDANGNRYGPVSSSFTTQVAGPPTVTAVAPPSGPVAGGNSVTVTGTNLTGAFEVDFGPTAVTSGIVVSPDGTSLTVGPPAGTAGTVDVRVKTSSGTSAITPADQYRYVAPALTAYTGSHLALSPASAGPNPPHTSQTLQATLTDRNSKPWVGMEVGFAVAGANPTATSAPTNRSGVATFTYTGASAGVDTVTAVFTAGPDTATSNSATITWAVPTTPVVTTSMDPAAGNFFAEPAGATTFIAKPGDTPAFAQAFPDIAFNPPAGTVPNDHSGVTPATHPLTDITTDVAGNADGTLPAAGNGQQAGVGGLNSFDAVLTTALHVSQAGDLSYTILASDGFLLGVGNGASRVSGAFVNPPASQLSAFSAYPLVATSNQPAGGVVGSFPVTIHFPNPGDYPLELDYFSIGAPLLSLVFSPSVAVPSQPNTPPVNVYVGYQDTLRASNDFTISPLPWFGSPGVTFEGDSAAQGPGADSGGIRFDNVTNAPVTLDQITVDIPRPGGASPFHYDQWPKGIVVPVGQTVILAENAGFASFDSSDVDSGACGVIQDLVPAINVTVGGVTSVYHDTGEVLNTGGFDLACLGNESEPWSRVGTAGPAHPMLPPPRNGAAAVWDSTVNAFVVFGGFQATTGTFLGDTWAWQHGRWTSITPPTTPSPRAFAASAYDGATDTFVLFGGYNTQTGVNNNDTWTFDGASWTQRHPSHSPPVLHQGSDRAAYDPLTQSVVLVTADNQGSATPDTWTWDGTDWTEHATATQPSARWQPALAFDPDAHAVVMFGGSTGFGGPDLADTWQWDGTNWTQLHPAASPGARAAATMDDDPVAGGLVLFGGDQGNGDTWLYKGGTWSQITPAAAPPGRDYASSAFDPVDRAELVAFGDQNANLGAPLGDLWLFNGQTWGTNPASPVVPGATSLALSPGGAQSHAAGQALSLLVSATSPAGQPIAGAGVTVTTTGANPATLSLTTGVNGTATFTDPGTTPGIDRIQASANLNGTPQSSNAVTITWTAPAGPPPSITAAAPVDGSVITAPTPVSALVAPPSGQSIATWTVTAQSSAPGALPLTLASGTGNPPATVAVFDPTVLANGQYDVTVTATASGGGVQSVVTTLSVARSLKLGAYQATYHELTIPVKGLAMTVDRVYNTTDHSAGDFGTGWHVAISNFQVSSGRPLGASGWQQYPTTCGFLGCNYAYLPGTVSHSVTVTWPDGHQEIFDFAPTGGSFAGLQLINPGYTARPGTNTVDTLSSPGSLAFGSDGNLYNSLFAQANNGTLYDPSQFTLTTPQGDTYQLDTVAGLLSKTDAAGNAITVDGNGVHGSNGQSITFARDGAHGNRIAKIAGPDDGVNGQDQHWTYTYNAAGQLAGVTDPVTTVNYGYDPASGELLRSTDANNQPLTTITYGPDGRVTSIANGSNPPTTVTSSAATRTQTITDPNGKLVTSQLYDTSGDLVEQDQAFGAKSLKTTYAYDPDGRLTSTTDPTGAKITTAFDETPGPTKGNIVSQTDADGRTTVLSAYNQSGLPGQIVGPDGTVEQTVTFDSSGFPLNVDVPGHPSTIYSYNPDGTVATKTDAAGRTTTYAYDANGNPSGLTDAAGSSLQAVTDGAGRVMKQVDQSGYATTYTYDGNGNITSVKNAQTGASTTVVNNGFNKPTTVTDQTGHATIYSYNSRGDITRRNDPDGAVTTYTYNADGNPATKSSPTGTTHFAYDSLNRLIEADNANTELNFGYDDAGHLLTQMTCAPQPGSAPCPPGSPTITHVVDAAGLVTSSANAAGTTTYAYDKVGRLLGATDPSAQKFTYGYDSAGSVTTLVRPNGVTDTETFNDANQPVSLSTTDNAKVLASATNTLDTVTGQINHMTDLAGTNTYTYQPDGTLATATHPAGSGLANEVYTYDSAGNRLSGPDPGTTSTYDAANRLLTDRDKKYTWNGQGELASSTLTATGAKTSLSWDTDQHVLTVTTTGAATTNTYDPLGRLIRTAPGNGPSTTYSWDGQTLVQQATAGSTTNLITEPSDGDPSGAPSKTLEVIAGGTRTYPLYNLHGDWINTVDDTGHLTQTTVEYGAFGTTGTSSDLTAGFDNYPPFGVGQYNSHTRIYDPTTGRFLSQDPQSAPYALLQDSTPGQSPTNLLRTGNSNEYAYADANPLNRSDPNGAEALEEEASIYRQNARALEALCRLGNQVGVTLEEAAILIEWANELGLKSVPPHFNTPPDKYGYHFQCGRLRHIPIKP